MSDKDTSALTNRRRASVAGAVATLLFHGLVVVVLLTLWLRYSPADLTERTWPPVDSSEVLFGGEYVMTDDLPIPDAKGQSEASGSPSDASAAPADPADTPDASAPAAPAPALTSEVSSPAKASKAETPVPASKVKPTEATPATPSPSQSTPTQAEIEAARRREQEAREKQVKEQVASNMKFKKNGSSGSSTGDSSTPGGNPGQPDGNASTGALSGKPGVSLNGRTIASWKEPPSAPMGTITIRVTVNRQGIVTDASYASGTGPAATSTSARNSCVAAARASRFSVDTSAPPAQTGTITYHFR